MRVTHRQAERVLALCHNPALTLKMDWNWSGTPTPTILTEGICDAIALCEVLQERIDKARVAVFVEPYSSYAISLYRKPSNWRCTHCGAEYCNPETATTCRGCGQQRRTK